MSHGSSINHPIKKAKRVWFIRSGQMRLGWKCIPMASSWICFTKERVFRSHVVTEWDEVHDDSWEASRLRAVPSMQ